MEGETQLQKSNPLFPSLSHMVQRRQIIQKMLIAYSFKKPNLSDKNFANIGYIEIKSGPLQTNANLQTYVKYISNVMIPHIHASIITLHRKISEIHKLV